MAFSEKLSAYRKAAALSQEQLADKLGVSRQAITKWERGSVAVGNESLAEPVVA